MIVNSLAELDRMVGDGKITTSDADEIRDFAELLKNLGPPNSRAPYTVAEAVAMEKYSRDRDPKFAARLRTHIQLTWIRECQ